MNKTIRLRIPLGYKLTDKKETMKVWQAEACLLSRRGKRYTKAVRRGEEAVLYARYLVCPHCGTEFVANANFMMPRGDGAAYWEWCSRISRGRTQEWASMQLSLFEETPNGVLLLAPPVDVPSRFTCPVCTLRSYASSAQRDVELQLKGKKIMVSCAIVRIDELLALEWAKVRELRVSFPIYEVLTFDLARGRVYVKVEDANKHVLCQRDITDCPERLRGGAVHQALTQNKVVQRNVKRMFQCAWGSPLPYQGKQVQLMNMFQMTMFVGYPREFYDAIPYVRNSYRIDRSFRTRAKRLHLAKNAEALYAGSGLPQVKSLRRILFANPGLFFYAEEILQVWNVLRDYNLMCRFLQGSRSFEILSALHMRPGMVDYLVDFCTVKGAKTLCEGLESYWELVCQRAVDYSCMSIHTRKEMQACWRSKHARLQASTSRQLYSLPMARPDQRIGDCTLDGYSFAWLRNSNAYMQAGTALKNCLREWRPQDPPVVCVSKDGVCVAAIEVYHGRVTQARGYRNGSIREEPELFEAIRKWMDRNRLDWGSKEEEEEALEAFLQDMEEGNLPF